MHEFSITERLFQLALEQANLSAGERIERLHIELASESGYSPDAIRFYFEQLAQDTAACGAELCFQALNNVDHIRLTAIDIDDSMPTDGAVPIQREKSASEGNHIQLNKPGALARWAINISGLVHNVEFLPFVEALAEENNLNGWVSSTHTGVSIEAQGQLSELEHFCHHLQHDGPPLTRILNMKFNAIAPVPSDGFEIRATL